MNIIKELSIARNRLVYKLISSEKESVTSYGIMVTTTLFGAAETEFVENVTTEIEFAEDLLSVLANNTVLPSTLHEITEEYISMVSTVCS